MWIKLGGGGGGMLMHHVVLVYALFFWTFAAAAFMTPNVCATFLDVFVIKMICVVTFMRCAPIISLF